MGGNASGLAVATSTIFDYWIDVEGVNNLIEEYLVARSVAPFNEGAALAVDEIEEVNGGALEDAPENYIRTTNVARADDIALNGLTGAIVINGLDDGLVPTDQSPQMTAALTAAGVTTHQYTVLLRGDGESGTTGTAIVAGEIDENYESPLAGHGWEGSDTHLVIKTSLDLLWDLIAGDGVTAGATIVDGLAA